MVYPFSIPEKAAAVQARARRDLAFPGWKQRSPFLA
jgi:hypothetical protein